MPETIAERVEEMTRRAGADPDPRMAPFAREQAALVMLPRMDGVAPPGSVLPDAELIDVDGAPRRLSQAVAGAPAVLVFYRGAWCPYCNIALRTYQTELLPALRDRGVGLIAVSPEKPDGSMTMKEKHGLAYEVLSDPGLALARAANVVTEPAEETVAAQLGLGLDLREVNADGTRALPLPTVAILDQGLAIRWIDVFRNYAERTEPAAVLAALDELGPRW